LGTQQSQQDNRKKLLVRGQSAWRQEVEAATQAEFGFPLLKLVELLGVCHPMG